MPCFGFAGGSLAALGMTIVVGAGECVELPVPRIDTWVDR
jgi:hypothetical protein